MATYPLKNIAIGSDTYEIKNSGYNTVKVTGTVAPYKFKGTNISGSNISCTDPDGNTITITDVMKARYTTPVRVIYYISDDNNYITYETKFEHTSANTVSLLATIRRFDNNNVDTKQVALPTIYINCTGSDALWSVQYAAGILLEPITTVNVKINNNFNTVADFVTDVLAGTTPSYTIGTFTFYKTDIDTIWSSNNDLQNGNIDFGICLPTPKATFKAVSKWIDNNDYYFIINVYTTYTVGSDTHIGLVPLLGKIIFTTGSNQKISGFTFERIYTAND